MTRGRVGSSDSASIWLRVNSAISTMAPTITDWIKGGATASYMVTVSRRVQNLPGRRGRHGIKAIFGAEFQQPRLVFQEEIQNAREERGFGKAFLQILGRGAGDPQQGLEHFRVARDEGDPLERDRFRALSVKGPAAPGMVLR